MSGLALFHQRFLDHDPGRGHPERPARLTAIMERIASSSDVADVLEVREAQRADDASVLAVHTPEHLAMLRHVEAAGGGSLDPDTHMSERSLEAALLAAGSGLQAVDAVQEGADFAFCLVRPPGHHAGRDRAMGFCLLNNLAIATAYLRSRGNKVAVVDWDAHHGNGTQDLFWDDPGTLYISLHEYPAYPGTGRSDETGPDAAPGTTVNVPLPHSTGEATYLQVFDQVVAPVVMAFEPDLLMVSAGFDAHRDDPITDMGLRALSFGLLAERVQDLARDVTHNGVVAFLEGGYDLQALADSFEATVLGLAGQDVRFDEAPAAPDHDPSAQMVVAQAAAQVRELWF